MSSEINKGYWIVHADVSNQEKFFEYASKTPKALKKYGARFLARAGVYELAEGQAKPRNSIIEFPSYHAALACWESVEYQEAKQHREGACQIDIVIVEGCGAEQA